MKTAVFRIKADQVYEWFIENEEYPQRAEKYMQFDGKPLLMVYLGTPTFISDRNPLEVWNDERFTVRYVTGYITEQSSLRDSRNAGKHLRILELGGSGRADVCRESGYKAAGGDDHCCFLPRTG